MYFLLVFQQNIQPYVINTPMNEIFLPYFLQLIRADEVTSIDLIYNFLEL